MAKPVVLNDPLYLLLREGKVDDFNARRQAGENCSLRGCNFRSLDLRSLEAGGLDLRDAYFRQTDLRGIDLRGCLLEGASIFGAKISGAYFPENISADEILLSLEHGTRMRSK